MTTKRAGQRARPRSPAVEILVDSNHWKKHRDARAIVKRAIGEAACVAALTDGEITVMLTDDAAIRALNRAWRGMDTATNVLSFPVAHRSLEHRLDVCRSAGRAAAPRLIGDIVISYETTRREARAEHKPFGAHLAHLAVHGFLHLVGYDHQADPQAAVMEALETAILARLDVDDPYAARSLWR